MGDVTTLITGFPGLIASADAVDYFDHPTRFSCEHTRRDLAGSGIACPLLTTYLPTLVDVIRRHPEIDSGREQP